MIGTIVDFEGSMLSGLAQISIRDAEDGRTRRINCDNAPTVRALSDLFPGCARGHVLDVSRIRGRAVRYGLTEGGLLLGWLAPPEEDDNAVEAGQADD